ncbi:hypothetical protein NKDENANG_03966 [Candidatus Entotheonellaceae bacterium PAL068K]
MMCRLMGFHASRGKCAPVLLSPNTHLSFRPFSNLPKSVWVIQPHDLVGWLRLHPLTIRFHIHLPELLNVLDATAILKVPAHPVMMEPSFFTTAFTLSPVSSVHSCLMRCLNAPHLGFSWLNQQLMARLGVFGAAYWRTPEPRKSKPSVRFWTFVFSQDRSNPLLASQLAMSSLAAHASYRPFP